jgi:mannose-6-phosphate isomerase-like protein (cupin superfamily)
MKKPVCASAAIMFAICFALGARAQDDKSGPSKTVSGFVVLRGQSLDALLRRLQPEGREDLIEGEGLQTTLFVQRERDKENEAEIHDKADDYHLVLEGAATYTLGGRLDSPREIRPGEWRSQQITGGQKFEVKKGDLIFVPRGAAHHRSSKGTDFSVMLIKVLAEARQRPDIRSRFAGIWKLVISDEVRPNGEIVLARGKQPRGLLVYTRSGLMSVQVMSDGRPEVKGATVEEGSIDEVRAALAGYTAYFGSYEINEREGLVLHRMEGNLIPNEIGGSRKRFYEFSANRLILTAPVDVGGERRTRRIIWERVE